MSVHVNLLNVSCVSYSQHNKNCTIHFSVTSTQKEGILNQIWLKKIGNQTQLQIELSSFLSFTSSQWKLYIFSDVVNLFLFRKPPLKTTKQSNKHLHENTIRIVKSKKKQVFQINDCTTNRIQPHIAQLNPYSFFVTAHLKFQRKIQCQTNPEFHQHHIITLGCNMITTTTSLATTYFHWLGNNARNNQLSRKARIVDTYTFNPPPLSYFYMGKVSLDETKKISSCGCEVRQTFFLLLKGKNPIKARKKLVFRRNLFVINFYTIKQ